MMSMKLVPLIMLLVLAFGCAQAPPQPQAPAQPAKNATQQNQIPPTVVNTDENATPPAPEPAPPVKPEAPAIPSKEISYYSGGWVIYGTLYPSQSKTPTRTIILAPMLGADRTSYPSGFIKKLHDQMPNAIVLAIDMRGNGKSTNLGSYRDFDTATYKDMRADIIGADKYLGANYPTVKAYYVVGASMGSTAALLAGAQFHKIEKVAMLSPGMDYQGVEIAKSLPDYSQPLFVAATSGDAESVTAASQIASMGQPGQVTKEIYKGSSAHGTEMFDGTALEADLLSFLEN
ncbi:MAG: alpha/beta hydrolase [Candidatus Micrarchaeia archaeon]